MSRSDDAGHYFQTSDAIATNERKAAKAKNKRGSPIKLPSKILAVQADPGSSGAIFVAEAAGEVKCVTVETSEVRKVFGQGNAPLTSLAISASTQSLCAGCWDKNIYRLQLDTKRASSTLKGHTDFVKCLLTTSLNGRPILISGGADAAIIVWDLDTNKQLHKLRGHTKSIQDLAIDPLSLPEGNSGPADSLVLFTASSDREIRQWHISRDAAHETSESTDRPILAHDTSVYRLCFDSDGDLWTASADKTAKHLVRTRNWEADTTLQHPDFVRDVIVAERLGLVVTACRDEEVRVWDMSSGELVCTYSGHYEEVTGLVLMGSTVASVSIDGTVRSWGLGRQDMQNYQEEMKDETMGNGGDDAKPEEKSGMLTAEEEAELAELMGDDE